MFRYGKINYMQKKTDGAEDRGVSKFAVKYMKCNICGRENEVTYLAMGSQQGGPDLDYRPAEVRRSAMPLWVRKCDYCRNVFSTSEKMPEYEEKYIDSKEYVNCGNIAGLPEQAKRFVKIALIYRHCREFKKAGDYFLYAAWVCDDEKMDAVAIVCRKRALKCYNEVNGAKISARELPDFLLRILDVMRRAGLYDEVIEFASNCDFEDAKDAAVCNFQIRMAKEKNKKCFRIEDVKE